VKTPIKLFEEYISKNNPARIAQRSDFLKPAKTPKEIREINTILGYIPSIAKWGNIPI
jgi:hypothetical protein